MHWFLASLLSFAVLSAVVSLPSFLGVPLRCDARTMTCFAGDGFRVVDNGARHAGVCPRGSTETRVFSVPPDVAARGACYASARVAAYMMEIETFAPAWSMAALLQLAGAALLGVQGARRIARWP